MAKVAPAHMRNRPDATSEGGESFSNEAHARNALRNASMYGDRDGTTAKATKQFPGLKGSHSGVHRDISGTQAKTISEHRREFAGKKLKAKPEAVAPKDTPETMAESAPAPESTAQMGGSDTPNDGDANYLSA